MNSISALKKEFGVDVEGILFNKRCLEFPKDKENEWVAVGGVGKS